MSNRRRCSCGKTLHWERRPVGGAEDLQIVWCHQDRTVECQPEEHPFEYILPGYTEGEIHWPVVGYNDKMEWLDFITERGMDTTVTEYASTWVAILWNHTRTRVVGFRVNGFLAWVYSYVQNDKQMTSERKEWLLNFLKTQQPKVRSTEIKAKGE